MSPGLEIEYPDCRFIFHLPGHLGGSAGTGRRSCMRARIARIAIRTAHGLSG